MFRKSVFLFIVLFAVSTFASNPRLNKYSDNPDNLMWFLIISDTHIGEKQDGGDQDTVNLNWVMGEAYTHINPAVIFNTGDLTDATNGGLIPTGQHDEEWKAYQNILLDNNITFDQYVDMPGNHDQYSDKGLKHYLKYSMGGQYDGKTQHNVIRDYDFGKYQFITTATCANDGKIWPFDNTSLDSGEMKFITDSLDADKDSSLSFVFGHHPLYFRKGMTKYLDTVLKDGDKFFQLLKKYNVLVYFYGHTHQYYSRWKDGVLLYNLASLGKSKGQHFVVVAIDNNSLALRALKARDWPYVLTTAPADKSLSGGNPYARPVPHGWDRAVVRALVFDVNLVKDVKFSIDGGEDQPMYRKHGPVWQGRFDATKLDAGEHELKVKYKGHEHATKFMVATTQCSDGIDNDKNGLTDYPDDPGCESKADNEEKSANTGEPDNEVADQQPEPLEDAGTSPDTYRDAYIQKDVRPEGLWDVSNEGYISESMLSKDDLAQNTDLGTSADPGTSTDPGTSVKDSNSAGEGLSSETINNPPSGSCQYSQSGSMPSYGGLLLFLLMGFLLISRRKSWRPE